jgi:hypothetical protein
VKPISVVIPAKNAARTLPLVLQRLQMELERADELIVVDDGSSDDTAAIATAVGARVLSTGSARGSVGAARNLGWDAARHDPVVFLDADALVATGWRAGVDRATREFPGAVVGCGRGLTGHSPWSWTAQIQVGTPWLPTGEPRRVGSLPSFCLVVPRDLPTRWDTTFGGEDGLFTTDVIANGHELIFDPRFFAVHEEYRDSFRAVRSWHARLAYGMARCGAVQREGLYKRVLTRVPLHYFVLLRLPRIYARLRATPDLRRRFVRLLPWMIAAEWSLGVAALRYAARRPPLRSDASASAFS